MAFRISLDDYFSVRRCFCRVFFSSLTLAVFTLHFFGRDSFAQERIAPISIYSAIDQDSGCLVFDESDKPFNADLTRCSLAITTQLSKSRLVYRTTSQGPSRAAKNAYRNASAFLSYLKLRFGRNSYDNRGSEIQSLVDVDRKGQPKNFVLAAWDNEKKLMVYGVGVPERGIRDLTEAMDIAGHELTHAVIDSVAHLQPYNESGAIAEAYADFYGLVIAHRTFQTPVTDWRLGEEVVKRGSAIRDLKNPKTVLFGGKRPYPSHVSEMERFPLNAKCHDGNDRCGVHFNSTVWGHMMVLTYEAIGPERAEKLFYQVLAALNPVSSFRQAALATRRTCQKLYDGVTCSRVSDALTQVGLSDQEKDLTVTQILRGKS